MSLPWLSDPRRPLTSPREIPKLEAWFDALDPVTMLTGAGATITDGGSVALWSDKSGNSGTLCYVSGTAASNSVSSPNKSVTGNQTFTLDVGLDDYTPGSDLTVVSKLSGNDGFAILVLTTGVVRLRVGDGASVTNVDSSAAFTMTDLRRHTIGIAWTDGVGASFTQDGAAVGTAVVAAKTLTNAAVACTIGTITGRIYRVQIGSVYDFNPAGTTVKKLTNGDTLTTGGDVWTLASTGATGGRIAGERDKFQGTAANRPVWLRYTGTKYAYFAGIAGFTVSVPLANDTYDVAITYKDTTTDTSTVVVGAGVAAFGGTDVKFAGKMVTRIVVSKSSVTQATFDPSLYTSGTSFTSSDALTWTINGGAHIVTRTGLYFDGSNDYLKSAAFSLSQPETVYFVGEQVSWTAGEYIYDGNAQNTLAFIQNPTTPSVRIYAGSNAADNGGWVLKTNATATAVFNGAASSVKINRGTATTGNAGTATAGGFTLGVNGTTPSAYGNMLASEVAIYSAAHDTATQNRMALFASRK